jgi:glutathione S-transferase
MSASSTIVIYSIPGSQYVFKVLAALVSREIPHYVYTVPMPVKKRKKILPTDSQKVPQMVILAPDGHTRRGVIADSELILQYLNDDAEFHASFFPNELAHSLSERASNGSLSYLVLHYNWVDNEGYRASIRESIKGLLPKWLSFTKGWLVDRILAADRVETQKKVMQGLNVDESVLLNDPERFRNLLLDELRFFQSFLSSDHSDQPYLIPNATKPTAADLSLYAQLERLVGTVGTASDVPIPASIMAVRTSYDGLERLWEWHDHIRQKYPVKFKGKEPPVAVKDEL